MSRSPSNLGPLHKEVLDYSIFQGMKRHNYEPPARLQHALGRGQRQVQFVQFLIDKNAKRLKRPRGRVDFPRLRPHHTGDDVGQHTGGLDGRLLTRRNDGARDGAGTALFAEDVDDVRENDLVGFRDDIRRGWTVVTHSHIQRTIEPKREAAFALVELHRGYTDIHHHPVDGANALSCANVSEFGKPALHQRQSAPRLFYQIETAGDRRAITVDPDDARSRNGKNAAAITAAAKSGVDKDAAVARREHLRRFTAKDRNVTSGRIHAPPPGAVRIDAQQVPWCRASAAGTRILSPVFRLENPSQRALAGLSRSKTGRLISRCHLLGCHGVSSVNAASAVPRDWFGCSLLSNGS